jgi:ribosome biogenesis protein Tsr3
MGWKRQERNAERLDDATRKHKQLLPTMTAATPAKFNKKTGI